MKRHTALPALAIVLAGGLVLSGCATPDPGPAASSTSPGGSTGTGQGSPEAAGHNEADTMFAQMMIPHHEQAVEMSEIMLAKGSGVDARIRDLANDIKAAQGPEIEKMQGWLQSWGEPMDPGSMDHSMSGMMSDGDLAALRAAEGDAAAEMFLTQMIAHHEGAVQMAKEEAANGSNPEARDLAAKVVADQEAEIQTMEKLLPDYR